MAGWRETGRAWRAIVAACALYGILLHGFMLAMSAGPAMAGPGGLTEICVPDGHGSPGDGRPSDHRAQSCCTAGCAVPLLPVPDLSRGGLAAWPSRPSSDVAGWHAADTILATGPPVHAASPRGPPSA